MTASHDLDWIRRQIISALAADDLLFEELVLKGGNALRLIHQIGNRASLDLDYSLEGDPGSDALHQPISKALTTHFARLGYVVFDVVFLPRPKNPGPDDDPTWGGYNVEFKIIDRPTFDALGGELDRIRREAVPVGTGAHAGRKFRIEISKHEFCSDRVEIVVEGGLSCWVYTLELLAAEKLRSICQQMDEYSLRAHPTPRAKDFYDLHALVHEAGIDFSSEQFHQLVRQAFAAKHVPLILLDNISAYRSFHEQEWPSVVQTIPPDKPRDYSFYVDSVIEAAARLKSLWIE